MMTTKRKFGRRSKNSPIRTRKINLTWHADFWEFYKNNRSDIDYIIRANIQSRFQPTAAVSERDLENDILVKLHDSDFLQHFCPSKSSLNTYLTAKIRYHIKHVINRMSTRSRILGHQMMTSDINSYAPSATDGMFQLRDQESCTDRLAVENEIIARIAEDLPRKTQKVLKMKLDEHTLTEISKKMGCSVEFVRQLKEKIYEKARRVLGLQETPLEKARPCQRQKAPEQPLTLKMQLAQVLKRTGPLAMSEIYKRIAKYRPKSPTSSIRARIYGSIQNSEGLFERLSDGRYGAL